MRFEDAESDCSSALKLDSLSAKALLRRGVARMGLSKYDLARKDFTQVVALEPKNRSETLGTSLAVPLSMMMAKYFNIHRNPMLPHIYIHMKMTPTEEVERRRYD